MNQATEMVRLSFAKFCIVGVVGYRRGDVAEFPRDIAVKITASGAAHPAEFLKGKK